jgi:predicted DNA-binding transcriptional regulator AlpA
MFENQFDQLLETLSTSIAEKVLQKVETMAQAKQPTEEYLNTSEAMRFLQIKSKLTLRNYVKTGMLPTPTRVGGRKLMYRKSDLENFLSHGRK